MTKQNAPDAVRELATLYPAPAEILIAGRLITIPVCTLTQTGNLMSAGMRLLADVTPDGDALSLLDSHPEESAELLAMALGIERAWVDELDVADRARIVAAWIRVNGAFFVYRLMPAWIELHQAVAQARGGGSTSLPNSSATASRSPAATATKPQPGSSAPSSAKSGALVESA